MSIKNFNFISKLGQGAYSSVYKVQRLTDGKQYALKKVKLNNLSQKQIQNAVNQVRILASINTPNIISYKQAFMQGKNLYIIMQFADDGDLYQKILIYKKNKQLFKQSQIWSVLIQVTRGLKVLHQLKIFHRDLKSANVFLTKDGLVKLGDMNVSKIAKNGLLYTQTGTPYYASPQVWKDQPYDCKSDIWSLGCVIYQMCTLQPPFKAPDMQGLYQTITKGRCQSIAPHFTKQLGSVIKLMLQQNPINRPSTQKLLKSSLLNKKAHQLKIQKSVQNNIELLKTIRIPKKINYLSDRLPKSNYSAIKSIDSLIRCHRHLQNSSQNSQRQSTLPRLQGPFRSNDQKGKNKQITPKLQRKLRNNSMQAQDITKLTDSQIKIDLPNSKNQLKKYITRLNTHIQNKIDQRNLLKNCYHQKIILS